MKNCCSVKISVSYETFCSLDTIDVLEGEIGHVGLGCDEAISGADLLLRIARLVGFIRFLSDDRLIGGISNGDNWWVGTLMGQTGRCVTWRRQAVAPGKSGEERRKTGQDPSACGTIHSFRSLALHFPRLSTFAEHSFWCKRGLAPDISHQNVYRKKNNCSEGKTERIVTPRTPLFRPDQYFAVRQTSIGRALAVVAIVTVAFVASGVAIGWIFTLRIDGTVLVDNPARPPAAFCTGDTGVNMLGEMNMSSGCDQPKQIERNIDPVFWSAFIDMLWQFVWALPLGWLIIGLLLHIGSWLAGGEGGVGRSFVVAAWGMAPTLVAIIPLLVVLAVTLEPVTVTPTTQATVLKEQLLGQLGIARIVGTLAGVVMAVWGGIIWGYGLLHARNLSAAGATVVAGLITLLVLLGSIL